MLTLAEELLLIALDDTKGKVLSSEWGTVLVHSVLERGLFGALLIELASRERLEVQNDHLVVTDPSPTGVAILDEILDILGRSQERLTPQDWIQRLGRDVQGIEQRLLDGLVEQGILREEQGRFLWVFPTRSYPTEDDGPERGVRERVSAFLAGEPPDPRTLQLVRLVSACKLVELIADREQIKEAEARIQTYRAESDAALTVANAATKQVEEDLIIMFSGAIAGAVIAGATHS